MTTGLTGISQQLKELHHLNSKTVQQNETLQQQIYSLLSEIQAQQHTLEELHRQHLQAQATPPQPKRLLTIGEAANFLHLSVSTLYTKVGQKALPYHKQGRRLYFDAEELEQWLRNGQSKKEANNG